MASLVKPLQARNRRKSPVPTSRRLRRLFDSAIEREFGAEVQAAFGNNLVCAFLCGSYARLGINHCRDLDAFVCLQRPAAASERRILRWYLATHDRIKRTPDPDYPGEFVSRRSLLDAIRAAHFARPSTTITNRRVFDGLVWSGMLWSPHRAFVGDQQSHRQLAAEGRACLKAWCDGLGLPQRERALDLYLKARVTFRRRA